MTQLQCGTCQHWPFSRGQNSPGPGSSPRLCQQTPPAAEGNLQDAEDADTNCSLSLLGCPTLKTALGWHRGAARSWLRVRGALSTCSTRHNWEGTRTVWERQHPVQPPAAVKMLCWTVAQGCELPSSLGRDALLSRVPTTVLNASCTLPCLLCPPAGTQPCSPTGRGGGPCSVISLLKHLSRRQPREPLDHSRTIKSSHSGT